MSPHSQKENKLLLEGYEDANEIKLYKVYEKLLDYVNSTYFIAASSNLVASGEESVVIMHKITISFS